MRKQSLYNFPEVKIDKPIRLIELFGGIGSQAMALRNLGADFEHYRLVEFDKYAVKSYNAIHGTEFETADIMYVHGADLGIVDKDKYCYLLTYSFPCTDLSVAGKMQGMSRRQWEAGNPTRSGLLWEVERILKELQKKNLPQILLMENVPQVHAEANRADFDSWLSLRLRKAMRGGASRKGIHTESGNSRQGSAGGLWIFQTGILKRQKKLQAIPNYTNRLGTRYASVF